MFFTKVGRVLAYIIGILEALRIVQAVLIISGFVPPEFQQRYLSSRPLGEVIDRAALVIAGCILIGVLAEISLSFRKLGKVE